MGNAYRELFAAPRGRCGWPATLWLAGGLALLLGLALARSQALALTRWI